MTLTRHFSLTIFAAATLALLVGCASTTAKNEAPGAASQATGLTPVDQRITDQKIASDQKSFDALQARMRKLNEAGVAQSFYPLAKAQCWLDTAKTQYHENDRTGYIEESLAESIKIIDALESNKTARVGLDTPLVARSTRLREDLWAQLSQFKTNETTQACTARTVACAEVRLVRAGHAQEQTGWRSAVPHVMMVEDALKRAADQAQSCGAVQQAAVTPRAAPAVVATPAPAAPVATPVPTPVAAPVVREVTKESFVLLADALFKFNKAGRDEMLPGGKERLQALAQRLNAYQSISGLRIVGHTDRLGSDAYNDALSARRAATIADYLSGLGVKTGKLEAIGQGKREPVTKNCAGTASRQAQIDCLQSDRRVSIEVTGFVK